MEKSIVVFLLLLAPLAAGYSVESARVGIVGGRDTNSTSYQNQIATAQPAIGEVNSTSFITQVGWIYVLLSYENVTINISVPEQDANINANPTITFDVNRNTSDDINGASITIDLNGTPSSDFNYLSDCNEFGGTFHCEYLETGLAADQDHNISFRAQNDAGEWSNWVERIVHFDATAPTITGFSAAASGSDVVLTYSGSDGFTGIETFYVRESGGTWIDNGTDTNYTFAGHASADHTYQVKARDFADNNSLALEATYTAPSGPAEEPEEPGPGGGGPGGGGVPPTVEGEFELTIVRADDPVEVGDRFDFTYLVENNTMKGGNVYIEYWLEQNGSKVVSGSETIYIGANEEKEISQDLVLLEEMEGQYDFYITLSRDAELLVTKERSTRMMLGAPLEIEIGITEVVAGEEEKPAEFSFYIGSNQDETLPILVQETLFAGDRLVWEKKQTVPVTSFARFHEEIYSLEPGNYRLEIEISHDDKTEKAETEFERKEKREIGLQLPAGIEPAVSFLAMAWPWILLIAAVIAAIYILRRRKGGKNKLTFK